jgi:hypothetical protein
MVQKFGVQDVALTSRIYSSAAQNNNAADPREVIGNMIFWFNETYHNKWAFFF